MKPSQEMLAAYSTIEMLDEVEVILKRHGPDVACIAAFAVTILLATHAEEFGELEQLERNKLIAESVANECLSRVRDAEKQNEEGKAK